MNWKVFIVFHKNIYYENYNSDKLFSSDYYTFLKVGNQDTNHMVGSFLDIKDFSNYIPLGKHYAEGEAIYNIYKNPEIYKNLDFIGFSQYDKPHRFKYKIGNNITEQIIENLIPGTHISLETYTMRTDFNQNIMMDDNRPDELVGNGMNCYYHILNDYNHFHGTVYCLSDIINKNINLCSSFIIPVNIFEKVMKFISHIIEETDFDKFDSQRRYRIQGGLLERYFGVAIMLENLKLIDLTIDHINQK